MASSTESVESTALVSLALVVAELAEKVADVVDGLEVRPADADRGAVHDVEGLRACRDRARELADQLGRRVDVDVLVAQRIDVTERDGTRRLVIASMDAFPRAVQIAGREIANERAAAGILFFNDKGDECGGLCFGGATTEHGHAQAGGLTFDQYQGDQVVQLWHDDVDGVRSAGVRVIDQPDVALPTLVDLHRAAEAQPAGEDRDAAMANLRAQRLTANDRVVLGRFADRSAGLTVCDQDGRVRLRIAVTGEGEPALACYDADGHTTWQATR